MDEINEDLSAQFNTALERFKEKLFDYGEDRDDLDDWRHMFFNATARISLTRPFTVHPALVHPFYVKMGHIIGNMHMATSMEQECYSRMMFEEIYVLR